MQNREEVIEAAMLARMVGSHLIGVDQLTTERSNNPANKINMENFVAPLLGKQTHSQTFIDPRSASPEMVKAYEGLNELALRSVPDPIMSHPQPNTAPLMPQVANLAIHTPEPIRNTQQQQASDPSNVFDGHSLRREDVGSIKNSLKNIDKTLAKMFTLLKEKETNV
jgi:hypothetical protein